MTPQEKRHLDLLRRSTEWLELGDWWTAKAELSRGGDVGGRVQLVNLTRCQRYIAESMRLQCASGEVEAAWHQLRSAERILTGGEPARLRARPAEEQLEELIAWGTTRLVLREKADLEALRRLFGGGLRRGEPEIVNACVERLTWVDFDPHRPAAPSEEQQLLRLDDSAYERFRDGNRLDICTRATHLRQFADVRRGSVSERTWPRMGGYSAVYDKALRTLSGEPLTRGREEFPVRLGRRRAWGEARRAGR